MTIYRTITVDRTDVFYRAAGEPAAATLLLLHGFPSSSDSQNGEAPSLDRHSRRWGRHAFGVVVQALAVVATPVSIALPE